MRECGFRIQNHMKTIMQSHLQNAHICGDDDNLMLINMKEGPS